MNAHEHHHAETAGKAKKRRSHLWDAEYIAGVVKTWMGALIGTILIGLFGLVVIALVIKAFMTSGEMSFHLLNSALTLVGTALGAALGYFLGRNSNDKPEQGS